MAGSKCNYLESKDLKHNLGESAFTMPTGTWLGLFTTDPTETGAAGSEVSTGGGSLYARQPITWAAESGGSKANGAEIAFPTAGANWGNIVYWVIFDAVTLGNPLYYGTWDNSVTINTGNTHKTATGGLVVTED